MFNRQHSSSSDLGKRFHTLNSGSVFTKPKAPPKQRGKSKITDDQVRRIRHLHEVDGYSAQLVHEIVGKEGIECHLQTIKTILAYVTRANVTGSLYSKTFPRFD